MTFPNSLDYQAAIQNPRDNLGDAELQEGQLVVTPLGLPEVCSGNFANVYKISLPETGHNWAVKCFTRPVLNQHCRYREIDDHLKQLNLPFMEEFTYIEQ